MDLGLQDIMNEVETAGVSVENALPEKQDAGERIRENYLKDKGLATKISVSIPKKICEEARILASMNDTNLSAMITDLLIDRLISDDAQTLITAHKEAMKKYERSLKSAVK